MIYAIAADIVVIVHLLFIVFALLGGFLMLAGRKWAFLHVPVAMWAALIEFRGWTCPLTPLENWLRQRGGREAYQEGFIEHYLLPVIYPPGLTRKIQVTLGIAVIAANLSIYLWMLYKTHGEG